MQLYYYRGCLGNFGDELNPLIWPRLLPGLLDADPSVLLVGMGTILSDHLPPGPRKVVMGSGTGYGKPATLDSTFDVRFVRGPNTAKALGLPVSASITDPAILLPTLVTNTVQAGKRVAFMPHHVSAHYLDWRKVCRLAGIRYLDPEAAPKTVIAGIRASRLLICEAMHGAIVADAFRVPWIPVRIYPHFNDFKWLDWTDSMQLSPTIHSLPASYDQSSRKLWHRIPTTIRAALHQRTPFPTLPSAPDAALSGQKPPYADLAGALVGLTRENGFLSQDGLVESKTGAIMDQVQSLLREYR